MSEFEEFKQSLIRDGYSEEMAHTIAKDIEELSKPSPKLEKGDK